MYNATLITPHIGQMITLELKRQRYSVTWLARQICCNRSNAYKILARANLDTALLMRISVALHHNFFYDIAQSPFLQQTISNVATE